MNIDWATGVITVIKTDPFMTFTGGSVYEMDTNAWRLAVMALEDDEDGGIVWPTVFSHNTTVLLGGIEYARTIELINGYTVTFDDTGGAWVCNLVGSNNNVLDATNLTTVQVRSNNSAGLINVREVQYGIFDGGVHVDQANGTAGTVYPAGTPLQPVNNLDDAQTIAAVNGFDTILLESGTFVFGAADSLDGYLVDGTSAAKVTVVLTAAANITNNIFRNCTLTGSLDGGNDASFCIIAGLDYIDGSLLDCLISTGDIVLSGTQANLLRCASAVAGGGAGQTVTIDMGGSGTDLVVRDFQGGMLLKNDTSGMDNISIDMSSGRVVFDPTISSGEYTVRGVAAVEDNSTGTAVVNVQVLDPQNLNRAAFTGGGVYLNPSAGEAGTVFPIGTPIRAVDNMPDAITIANREGLSTIFLEGFLALAGTEVLDGITVVGGSGASNVLGVTAGVSTVNAGFEKLIIYGQQNGLSRIRNCVLGVTGLGSWTDCEGNIVDCIINSAAGITQKNTGVGSLFDNCAFQYTNNPQITLDANGKAFSLRGCTGNVLVTNKTDAEDIQINMNGGVIEFAASCTNGSVQLTGIASLTDNSGVGCVVDHDNFLHADRIHTELKETWQRLGLDSANPLTNKSDGGITATGIDIQATPSGSDIIQTRQ